MNEDVLKRLPAEIAAQLSEAEREELARRLDVQDRLASQLRALPLEGVDPCAATDLERER